MEWLLKSFPLLQIYSIEIRRKNVDCSMVWEEKNFCKESDINQ